MPNLTLWPPFCPFVRIMFRNFPSHVISNAKDWKCVARENFTSDDISVSHVLCTCMRGKYHASRYLTHLASLPPHLTPPPPLPSHLPFPSHFAYRSVREERQKKNGKCQRQYFVLDYYFGVFQEQDCMALFIYCNVLLPFFEFWLSILTFNFKILILRRGQSEDKD